MPGLLKSLDDKESLIRDLGRQVVLKDSEILDLVFDDEGLLIVQAQSSESGQGGSLVKHVKVANCELLGHAFGNFESGALVKASSIVLSKLDSA